MRKRHWQNRRKNTGNLVENINDVSYIINTEGIITYISPMVSQFGYDAQDVLKRPVVDFIVPEDQFDIMKRLEEIRSGNVKPYEYRIRSRSGSIIWVRGSSRPDLRANLSDGSCRTVFY